MKAITTAWLSNNSHMSPEQILNDSGDRLVSEAMLTNLDMAKHGYTKIGTATIVFHLIDRSEMIDNKVVALQAEMQTIKADAQVKVQKLEDQLQSLLAIEVSK
jgi:hypothetical protein